MVKCLSKSRLLFHSTIHTIAPTIALTRSLYIGLCASLLFHFAGLQISYLPHLKPLVFELYVD